MKVLVVGGNGFLGKEIFKELIDNGHDVIGMGRSANLNRDKNWISADIGRPNTYRSFLSDWQPEVVVQSAWVTAQKTYRQSAENLLYASETLQFAKDCLQTGTNHFVGLGTSAEYGIQIDQCNAAKMTPAPVDLYGQMKLETLLELQVLTAAAGARLTWARVFQPYGLGQDSERLIPWAVERLVAGYDIELQNPFMKLDWISSRDIGRAISWSITHNTPAVIDIGTAIGTEVHQVLAEVANILEVKAQIKYSNSSPERQNPSQNLIVSRDSPLFQSGWLPADSLQAGLKWALGR
jgi:nucleoside-diphosphate-sugar epimerase